MKKLLSISLLLLAFFACKKESPVDVLEVKNDSFALYHKGTAKIEATTTGNDKITYESSDKFVAEVDENGNITAGVIGSADILVSSGKNARKCVVEVIPKHILFTPEPKVKIGTSKSDLLAQLNDGEVTEKGNTITYVANKGNEKTLYIHMYTMNGGSVESIAVLFNMLKSSYSSIVSEYLLERYIALGVADGSTAALMNKEQDMYIIIDYGAKINGYISVIYTKKKSS